MDVAAADSFIDHGERIVCIGDLAFALFVGGEFFAGKDVFPVLSPSAMNSAAGLTYVHLTSSRFLKALREFFMPTAVGRYASEKSGRSEIMVL